MIWWKKNTEWVFGILTWSIYLNAIFFICFALIDYYQEYTILHNSIIENFRLYIKPFLQVSISMVQLWIIFHIRSWLSYVDDNNEINAWRTLTDIGSYRSFGSTSNPKGLNSFKQIKPNSFYGLLAIKYTDRHTMFEPKPAWYAELKDEHHAKLFGIIDLGKKGTYYWFSIWGILMLLLPIWGLFQNFLYTAHFTFDLQMVFPKWFGWLENFTSYLYWFETLWEVPYKALLMSVLELCITSIIHFRIFGTVLPKFK